MPHSMLMYLKRVMARKSILTETATTVDSSATEIQTVGMRDEARRVRPWKSCGKKDKGFEL